MTLGVNYGTKKILKEQIGKPLNYIETSIFSLEYKDDGKFAVANDPYGKRNWFALITMKNGLIVKVE